MPPDRFFCPAPDARRATRPCRLPGLAAVCALAAGLAGCAVVPPAPPSGVAAQCAPASAASARAGQPSPGEGSPVAALVGKAATASCTPPDSVDPADAWTTKFLLTYAERLHGLSSADLVSEIASLGEAGQLPMGQMQLALALTHTHQAVDTARALGLFQRVVAHTAPGAAPYKPLARLMAARLTDQRRLEETVDKQSQQLREQQRRIEQLTERLEAMRAIERSLNSRPGTAPGGRGTRPPAAP